MITVQIQLGNDPATIERSFNKDQLKNAISRVPLKRALTLSQSTDHAVEQLAGQVLTVEEGIASLSDELALSLIAAILRQNELQNNDATDLSGTIGFRARIFPVAGTHKRSPTKASAMLERFLPTPTFDISQSAFNRPFVNVLLCQHHLSNLLTNDSENLWDAYEGITAKIRTMPLTVSYEEVVSRPKLTNAKKKWHGELLGMLILAVREVMKSTGGSSSNRSLFIYACQNYALTISEWLSPDDARRLVKHIPRLRTSPAGGDENEKRIVDTIGQSVRLRFRQRFSDLHVEYLDEDQVED